MKRFVFCACLLFVAGAFATAQEAPDPVHKVSHRVVATLMEGLSSENAGVRRSCALMLGQLRYGRARITLMAILRGGNDVRLRCAAAWALCRIGDPSGLMLVKSMAERDGDAGMRAVCAWYYRQAVEEQGRSHRTDRGQVLAVRTP